MERSKHGIKRRWVGREDNITTTVGEYRDKLGEQQQELGKQQEKIDNVTIYCRRTDLVNYC